MKRNIVSVSALALSIFAFSCSGLFSPGVEIGLLETGARADVVPNEDNLWGIAVEEAGLATMVQSKPVQLEFYSADGSVQPVSTPYSSVEEAGGGVVATASLDGPSGGVFHVEDHWIVDGAVLTVHRNLRVSGDAPGGFLSAVTLVSAEAVSREEADYFVPGMIYGSPDNLTKSAIGGADTFTEGSGIVIIREDRIPTPMFGVRFSDGASVTVLDADPQGDTTMEESHDLDANTLVDERYRFAAVGVRPQGESLAIGLWFPGSEGEVTYRGKMYPGGQMHQWRRRYHPIKDGLTQDYRVSFRFAGSEDFPTFYNNAWRWAWGVLSPKVVPQDIELARRSLVDMLGEQVTKTPDGRTGITNFIDAAPGGQSDRDRKSVMGFTGKTLETADFLLQDSLRDDNAERAARHRRIAEAIFDSYTKLKVDPPEGEGFDLHTGKPALAIPRDNCVFLRSFGDDIKATLRSVRRERTSGREHEEWLAWCRRFGDWLLTQQQPEGGFPRSWRPVTGEVVDSSPASTYNAVPMLVLLTELTSDQKYLDSALKAAEFSWNSGQANGRFVGGTIDNPDVIDKEAGTLSVEAYLSLYEKTKEQKWLDRAVVAANFSQTWIYSWNVPMPADEPDVDLPWKQGVPTVGIQPISTGHSLTDEYMAFDADEFARLSVYTGDKHYEDVARILLHNTKVMLAVPGRLYDLPGPGWQQEHWSMGPQRAYGIHRGWLPWVSTAHLNGIFGLEEFDAELFQKLAQPDRE